MALTHFLYRSNARPNLSDEDTDEIVAGALQRNRQLGITGCLHYEDGLFFQWIEGPKENLELLIEAIRRDPRHSDMVDLSYGPINKRHFKDWSLRLSRRGQASLLEWIANSQVSTIDRGAYAGSIGAFLMAISI